MQIVQPKDDPLWEKSNQIRDIRKEKRNYCLYLPLHTACKVRDHASIGPIGAQKIDPYGI